MPNFLVQKRKFRLRERFERISKLITGTNILYDIRRVELARGNQPSVRLMAKAFEAMEANGSRTLSNSKRSLFGIRKSHSVETTEIGKGIGSATKSVCTLFFFKLKLELKLNEVICN